MAKKFFLFCLRRFIFISTLPILLLISLFWTPFELTAQLRIEQQPLLMRLFPPPKLAIPFANDLGLIVFCPPEWNFLSQSSTTGTVPLFIYPPGSSKSVEGGYLFKNVIIVDIKPISHSFNLQGLVNAEQQEILKIFPGIKYGPKQIVSTLHNHKFITITAEDEASGLKMKVGFSKIGDKAIKIQLVSQSELYQENLDKFNYVLLTILPLKISHDRKIIKPQPDPLISPPETYWRNKLLRDGPYEYWKNFEAGTEVKFKFSQKFSGYSIQSERAFQVLSVDQEAAVINYQEKVTQASGQLSSTFPTTITEKIIEFIQAEEAFSQNDLFASNLGLDIGYFLSHPDAIVVAENTDKLSIQDETFNCERVIILIDSQVQPKRLTIWYSEAVPGGLVKFTLENLDDTQFYLEGWLSYSSKKRNAPIPPAEGSTEREMKEVPALFYLKQRLPLLWRGNTPFEYLNDLSKILFIFALYYLNINLNPEEAVSRLQPIMDELRKARQDYDNFLTRAREELKPEELTKISTFITSYENYLTVQSRRDELLIRTIGLSGTRDKKKLEELKSDIKSFSSNFSECLMLMEKLKKILKSLAGMTLKVKKW